MTTATQRQIRRDTSTNLNAATPALGEMGYDTTNKRLVVGDGTTLGGIRIPSAKDEQTDAFNSCTAGGTGNAITLTHGVPMLSYTGAGGRFKAAHDNTGPTTINADSLGLVTAKKLKGGTRVDLEAADILTNIWYEWFHDGTYIQIKPSSWSTDDAGGWELLAVASGGGSSYDFTSQITSDYNNYAFVLEKLANAGAAARLYIRGRRAGQPSFDAGGLDYYFASTGTTGGNGASAIFPGAANNAGTVISGCIFANGLGQAGYANFNGQINQHYPNNFNVCNFSGVRNSATALDAVRFLFSIGNISGGRILMYGLKNSL